MAEGSMHASLKEKHKGAIQALVRVSTKRKVQGLTG